MSKLPITSNSEQLEILCDIIEAFEEIEVHKTL